MNFIYASFSGRGEENNMSFSERIFGRRQSISSIIEQETEPREEISKEELMQQVAQLEKKLARVTGKSSFFAEDNDEGADEIIDFTPSRERLGETPDSLDMSQLLEALSKSNSLIAKTTAIAHEKDSLDFFKLKSMSSPDILLFLSNVKNESVQSAVKSVPPRLRVGLAFELGLDVSLEEAYGKDTGKNQPFLKALRYLVRARNDLDHSDLLSGLAMVKTTIFNRENIILMMAEVRNEIKKNPAIFEAVLPITMKKAIVSNLQPDSFRSLVERHLSEICDPSCDMTEVYAIISREITNETTFLRQQRLHGGVELLANTASVSEPKRVKCFNCDGEHRVRD